MKEQVDAQIKSNREQREEFQLNIRHDVDSMRSSQVEALRRFEDNISVEVQRIALRESESAKALIGELSDHANKLRSQIEDYEDVLKVVKKSADDQVTVDPYLNYEIASSLEGKTTDPSDKEYQKKRREAMSRLEKIVDYAREGAVDANLLFNSGMTASRLDTEDVALKLFTFAASFSPVTSHKLAKYRLMMTVGREYTVVPSQDKSAFELLAEEKEPKEIVEEAYSAALLAAADAPLPQNEIIYAELWNMSQSTREDNGYERMRDVFTASYKARRSEKVTDADFSDPRDRILFKDYDWTKQNGKAVPSNLCGKIAATYALLGYGDWKEHYNKYLEQAISIASSEIEMTTWKTSFLRDAKRTAMRSGTLEHFQQLLDRYQVSFGEDDDEMLKRMLMEVMTSNNQEGPSPDSEETSARNIS